MKRKFYEFVLKLGFALIRFVLKRSAKYIERELNKTAIEEEEEVINNGKENTR